MAESSEGQPRITVASRIRKSLKVSVVVLAVGYLLILAWFLIALLLAQVIDFKPSQFFLEPIAPAICAAIVAFLATYFLAGRRVEKQPQSLLK